MLRALTLASVVIVACTTTTPPDPLTRAQKATDGQLNMEREGSLKRLELEKAAVADALTTAGCRYEDTAVARADDGRYRVVSGCDALAAVVVRCDFKGAWTDNNRCEGLGVPTPVE